MAKLDCAAAAVAARFRRRTALKYHPPPDPLLFLPRGILDPLLASSPALIASFLALFSKDIDRRIVLTFTNNMNILVLLSFV